MKNVYGIQGLTCDDGDMSRLHLDGDSMYSWTAKTKKEYRNIENRINKIGKATAAFEVYAWCDISGFDYWVRRQNEPNYIQISVVVKRKLTAKQIEALKDALLEARCDAEGIAGDCENEVVELSKAVR